MVKVEDHDDDDSSYDELFCRNVGSSSSNPQSAPALASVKEENFTSSHSNDLKSYFVGMGFSSVIVDQVMEENGDADENVLLEALINYSKPSPKASDSWEGFSGIEKEEEDTPIEFTSDFKHEPEELNGPSNAELDKKSYLAMMDFSEEEINLATSRLGVDASLPELVDFIVTAQAQGASRQKLSILVDSDNEENEDPWDDGIDITTQSQNEPGPQYHAMEGPPNHCRPATNAWMAKTSTSRDVWMTKGSSSSDGWITKTKASSSNAAHFDYEDVKTVKKAKHLPGEDNRASCSNHMQGGRQDDYELDFETKPGYYHEPQKSAEGRSVKEEMPYIRTPNPHSNSGVLSKAPYFFYVNVVDVSQGTWRKLSQFLYATEPEFTNSQFFSALIRKEGYLHNLPTEGRFHVVPRPPMTIEDALPHAKKWWPSWDTRKQLSCINSEATGVVQLCERLSKMMVESQGFLSKEQQMDIIHQCKRLNLIWVGQHRLRPMEPDQVESILGYPREHTDIWGLHPTERLAALKYCFQTDTIAYHLSVLKNMYPDGLRVLSIFSGVGGAEIALHRLGIPLKCVVSVEASEINRKILKRWWQNAGQTGALRQIEGIEKLTSQTLENFMNQFGGFDIIIGSNPGDFARGASRDGSADMDFNLFFEFVRVFQRVRSIMGRNG